MKQVVDLKKNPLNSLKPNPRYEWKRITHFKHHILPPIEPLFTLMLEIYNRTDEHVVSHLKPFRVRFNCVSVNIKKERMNKCNVVFMSILLSQTWSSHYLQQ